MIKLGPEKMLAVASITTTSEELREYVRENFEGFLNGRDVQLYTAEKLPNEVNPVTGLPYSECFGVSSQSLQEHLYQMEQRQSSTGEHTNIEKILGLGKLALNNLSNPNSDIQRRDTPIVSTF